MNVEKILQRADGKRRVVVVRRGDGNYGLVEESWYENVFDGKLIAKGWAALYRPASVFETVEIAEREALATFPWLA